jgi:7,8-dihydropterin-6-yl-methyl-4-(beta-D-ribofuranosyl)aminobenzene 5'-phosphate synthase
MKIRIVILSDNTVESRNTQAEHGLAFWVETEEHCLLFDTGQGLVLDDNARALNLDLDAVDTVVLSHGHYDHTGGLSSLVHRGGGEIRVIAHPDAFLPKYKRTGLGTRDIGMPCSSREVLSGLSTPPVGTRLAMEVVPGIWSTGEIPRSHPEETSTEGFCTDPQGVHDDQLLDDQALFIDTLQGTVVLLGCAHAGLINTLDHIQRLTQGRPIHAVIGGTHLRSASQSRIAWTLKELKFFNLKGLVAMHCTGPQATAALWNAFPGICGHGGTGTSFDFEGSEKRETE